MHDEFYLFNSFALERILEVKCWYHLRQKDYENNCTEKEITASQHVMLLMFIYPINEPQRQENIHAELGYTLFHK